MHESVLAGYSNYRTMTEVETTEMWAEAKIGPGRRRIISSHLKMANNGVSICAPKHKINEIADRREQPERVCGSEKLKSTKTWKLGKGVVHTKVTEDSKRLFFECPYENVTIELKERLNAGKDCGGYLLL